MDVNFINVEDFIRHNVLKLKDKNYVALNQNKTKFYKEIQYKITHTHTHTKN